MKKETLKALKGSIEKWEKIVDCEGVDEGDDNCELCQNFLEDESACPQCPVSLKTNSQLCENTPHIKWCDYCFNNNQRAEGGYSVFDQKSQNLAIAELDFLKSLLPEE